MDIDDYFIILITSIQDFLKKIVTWQLGSLNVLEPYILKFLSS